MTYRDIANWAERNVPMNQADNYQEWKDMVEQEFLNAGHFLPQDVYPLLERKWLKSHDSLDVGKEDTGIDLPQESITVKEYETIGANLSKRIDKFPSDLEFTPSQIAKFTGYNKNTVRRELQELVAEGKIQRIAKGRYRLAP